MSTFEMIFNVVAGVALIAISGRTYYRILKGVTRK